MGVTWGNLEVTYVNWFHCIKYICGHFSIFIDILYHYWGTSCIFVDNSVFKYFLTPVILIVEPCLVPEPDVGPVAYQGALVVLPVPLEWACRAWSCT